MTLSKTFFVLSGLLFSLLTFTSCGGDDEPIIRNSNVTITNTFQSTAFTMGVETDIEELFQMPAGSLAATSKIDNSVEFPAYLLNLYDIDIDDTGISFTVVAAADDPTYGTLFRILEADTFDRYYFNFEEGHNVSGFTSSNSSVNLRTDSDKVIVVEIGEGYDFKPGQNFKITLN